MWSADGKTLYYVSDVGGGLANIVQYGVERYVTDMQIEGPKPVRGTVGLQIRAATVPAGGQLKHARAAGVAGRVRPGEQLPQDRDFARPVLPTGALLHSPCRT